MRTTSSMQTRLSTAIVPTEPAAVVSMGAPAQAQSGRHLSASLRLRVLSSLEPSVPAIACAAMRAHACMRICVGVSAYSCEHRRAHAATCVHVCAAACACVHACVRECVPLLGVCACVYLHASMPVVLCWVCVLEPVRARLDIRG
jgi:hypothetical protein